MQLLNTSEENGVAWVRILQNIIMVVDPTKVESSTNGDWRAVLCRCMSLLLRNCESSSAIPVFGLAAPVILQLSLLPGPPIRHLPSLVAQAVDSLRRLEDTVISSAWTTKPRTQDLSMSMHGAQGLHDLPTCDDPVQLWGNSVESLWRATMTFEVKNSTWDALTSRLLLWRAMVGEKSTLGEWARREAVHNLGS